MSKSKFYVTTAIDYASGKPHLGHAYEKVLADVLARYNREKGCDVFFLTGTDEHGQKIEKKARALNKTPGEFVNFIVPQFKKLIKRFNISNDFFIRTTEKKHRVFVSKMIQKAYDNGDIYKGTYEGLYCVECEKYYEKDDLVDGKFCPDHKSEVEFVSEENYFFKLSKYQDKLLDLYENSDFLKPKSRAQETINRVKAGLKDISISRNRKKVSWGVEIPFDVTHISYVWFDALFNYVSGLEMNEKQEFWPASVHIVGKDIKWFHEVYWPAFLMSVGLDVPKHIFSHGFILDEEGHKMSKSIGNVIDPMKFSKKYGVDEMRYAFLSVGSCGEDISFGENVLIERINNDLNNDLGNLVSRIHSMTSRSFDKVPTEIELLDEDLEFLKKVDIFDEFDSFMSDFKMDRAVQVLFRAVRDTNSYVNLVAPWRLKVDVRLKTVMNVLCSVVRMFCKYLNCIMPEKVDRILKQFGFSMPEGFRFEHIDFDCVLQEKDNLFKKLKKVTKLEKKSQEIRRGFNKLNLRVGSVYGIEVHPDSDKLFIIDVDLGGEIRQVVSGIRDKYDIADLIDKKIVVITNLKPAKLAGTYSYGMILACENKNGDYCLLTSDLDVGTVLDCDDRFADNDKEIKFKFLEKAELKSFNGEVFSEGKVVKGIFPDKEGFEGKIL